MKETSQCWRHTYGLLKSANTSETEELGSHTVGATEVSSMKLYPPRYLVDIMRFLATYQDLEIGFGEVKAPPTLK